MRIREKLTTMLEERQSEIRTVNVCFWAQGSVSGEDSVCIRVYAIWVFVERGVLPEPFLSERRRRRRGH